MFKPVILFVIGGLIYITIELLFRGYTHWTMFILGGLCFITIGAINEFINWKMSILLQMFIGAVIITVLEFCTGCIVNLWLDWGVWNYSNLPFNILGQICLWFSFTWYFISLVAIVLDDYLRYWIFDEEKPHYTILKWGK